MAKSVGCTHVLVGHSERRELFGETDEATRLKTRKVIDCDMTAVLCIGETKEEYETGSSETSVRATTRGGARRCGGGRDE